MHLTLLAPLPLALSLGSFAVVGGLGVRLIDDALSSQVLVAVCAGRASHGATLRIVAPRFDAVHDFI